jgi:hypothetical protein
MPGKDKERGVLRRYLLGELPEAERSHLADRYFVDEELFDELLDVENELLGQYVRKQLSSAESKRFSDYLGQLPDGASKLATAYALMEAGIQLREVHSSAAAATHLPVDAVPSVAPSLWQALRHRLLADRYIVRYATVVVLIALIAGLFYLSLNQWRRDTEQLRAETPQPEQIPAPEHDTRPDKKVAQTKEQEPRQEGPPTKRRSESGNVAQASLILTLPMRSGGTPDVLTLSPEIQTVSLVIPVPQEERVANYAGVLQSTSGRLILSNVRLRSQPSNGRTVSLRLSASQLANETYKLTLMGKAADGIEVAYDYYFKILRKQ